MDLPFGYLLLSYLILSQSTILFRSGSTRYIYLLWSRCIDWISCRRCVRRGENPAVDVVLRKEQELDQNRPLGR